MADGAGEAKKKVRSHSCTIFYEGNMSNEIRERIIYLNKKARKKNLYIELGLLALFIFSSFVLYWIFPTKKIFLFIIPVGLFVFARFYLFFTNNKALVLHNGKVYVCRSGFVAKKEMEKAYIAETRDMFLRKQRCIFFDLHSGKLYEPLYFEDWSLYALPSTIMAVCENDIDMPLEDLLGVIQKYMK